MRKFWKILSLVLAAVMIFSLAACTGNNATPTESTSGAATTTAGSSEESPGVDLMTPFTPYPETVTLTFARNMNRGSQLAPGETTSKNAQIDIIKQKLNVDCQIAWETSPDQYNQRLALSIAGGTLPDVFLITRDNYMTFKALVDNGALADLTEAYNKCIGGIAAEWLKAYDGKQLSSSTFDGKIMAIPIPVGGYNYNLLWVRNDWLKKVNLPAPKTADDIKNVALAFIQNKLGGPQTKGIVVDPVKPLWNSDSFLSLTAVANSQGAYPQTWIKGDDGKVVYGSIVPGMKNTLAILADWYKAGVLDPQWMTYQNMDAVTPALREGQCGMYFGAYWSPWTVASAVAQHPEMDWIPVLAPLDANGKYNHTNPTAPSSFVVVNKNCKNPEAVIKANNVEFELMNGSYDDDPAIVAAMKPSVDAGSKGRTISPFSGNWLSGQFDHDVQLGLAVADYCKTGTLTLPKYATPADKTNAEAAYKWFKNPDVQDQNGYSFYNSFMAEVLVADPNVNYDQPVAFSYTTISMADFKPALDDLEKQTFVQIISGQKPVDAFDEFVSQWKQSGGDIITEEVQQVVDSQG